jgi:hypothetical protein
VADHGGGAGDRAADVALPAHLAGAGVEGEGALTKFGFPFSLGRTFSYQSTLRSCSRTAFPFPYLLIT